MSQIDNSFLDSLVDLNSNLAVDDVSKNMIGQEDMSHNFQDLTNERSCFSLNRPPMTPANSQSSSSKSEPEETVVTVSSVFYPGGHDAGFDTIFRSQDTVLFYVRSRIILGACKNAFKSLMTSQSTRTRSQDDPVDIAETSEVLNVILHTLYNKSCAYHSPTFDTLETAVNRMPHYEILPSRLITPSTPLYNLLLSHAPVQAMRMYCLAARHDLYELASSTSSHLLAYPISSITDNLARKMGARYLRRLVVLHTERLEELKKIIRDPPHPHPPTPLCDFEEQKKLSRAWSLVAGYLAWDSRPDLLVQTMQSSFGSLGDHLACTECRMSLQSRIKNVVVQWVTVKVSYKHDAITTKRGLIFVHYVTAIAYHLSPRVA